MDNNPRRINDLLAELGDLLTPGHGQVSRAYALAQNSMAMPSARATAMEALAAELRKAAAAAEEIAALTRR
jgi:hypothetical protein